MLPVMLRLVKLLKTRRHWHWAIVVMWVVALGYGVSVLFPVPTSSRVVYLFGWPQSFILVPIVSVGGIIVLGVMGRTFLKRYGLLVAGVGVLSPFMYAVIFEPYPGNNLVGMIFVAGSFLPGIPLIIAGTVLSIVSHIREKKDPRTWKGHCRKCGYDLRGLKERRCPECGEPF